MAAYADTSFLVSLYIPDSNTTEAFSLSQRWTEPVMITPFGEAEFVNAIESRVFRKDATAAEAEKCFEDFEADLASQSFLVHRPVPGLAYERAMLLSRQHVRQTGTRVMDVLHIAISLELQIQTFFTFDQGQRKLAQRAGLTVRPRR